MFVATYFNTYACTHEDGVCVSNVAKLELHSILQYRKVKMDRSGFLVDPIIGQPFGTQFELHKGTLQPVAASKDEPGQSSAPSAGSDNRHINDDAGKAQLLTQEEIVEMKSTGISGQVQNPSCHHPPFFICFC